MIWTYKTLQFIFTDQSLSLSPENCYDGTLHDQLSMLRDLMQAQWLVSLQQQHANQGVIVSWQQRDALACQVGDYLITAQPYVGLVCFTADCIPCIVYDAKKQVCAVVHAGWRGLYQDIISHVVYKMKKEYGSRASDIALFFGPAIFPCCYTVDALFIAQWPKQYKSAIEYRDGLWRFDLIQAATIQALEAGILAYNIHRSYTECTACYTQFCSYRRDKKGANRNITVAMLID